MRTISRLLSLAGVLFFINCDLFFSGFENNRNKGLANPSDATSFQDKLTIGDSGEQSYSKRNGTIPAQTSNGSQIRFSDLRHGTTSNLNVVPSIITPAFGDATVTYNIFPGEYVEVDCVTEPGSQNASIVYFQIANAGYFFEFTYVPAVTAFTMKFKTADNVISGQVVLKIAVLGSGGNVSNTISVVLNIVGNSDVNNPPSTITQTTVTTETTQTTTTTTVFTTTTTLTTSTSTSTTTTYGPLDDGIMLFGGTGYENGFRIFKTADNKLIVAGHTYSTDFDWAGSNIQGGTDVFLLKFNLNGTLDTSFGINGIVRFGSSSTDYFRDMVTTSDGGFIIVGETDGNDGDFSGETLSGSLDIFIVKLLSDGSFDNAFQSNGRFIFGSTGSDNVNSVIEKASGVGYFVTGGAGTNDSDFAGEASSGSSDIFIISLNSNGTFDNGFSSNGRLLIGGSGSDSGRAAVDTGSGILVSGYTPSTDGIFSGESSYGLHDIFVLAIDYNGNPVTAFAGDGILKLGGSAADTVSDMVLGSNLYITGYTFSSDNLFGSDPVEGDEDMYVLSLTPTGTPNIVFNGTGVRTFGSSVGDRANSITFSDDMNSLYITGHANLNDSDFTFNSWNGGYESAVVKMDLNGNLVTAFNADGIRFYGSSGTDDAYSAVEIGNELYVSGFTSLGDTFYAGETYHNDYELSIIKLLKGDGTLYMP